LFFCEFYSADASRSTEGNGLGLSVEKAIIDLHQGNISLSDNSPGLLVVITLNGNS
jgi:signal transduction histidine kinase